MNYAPIPPEPVPWEGNEYEELEAEDSDPDSENEFDYESDDSSETSSLKSFKKTLHRNINQVQGFFKSILQEEEYFSE